MSELVNYQEKAIKLVTDYVKAHLEKTDDTLNWFSEADVYVVWFSKTLQNWKALISTMLPDGMYYEVTYNGDKSEAYIDAYKKFDNVTVRDNQITINISDKPDTLFPYSAHLRSHGTLAV